MKKNITILGSTGSIGNTTLKIIDKKKDLFSVDTLMAKTNYKSICKQINKYKPKNFVISDNEIFLKVKKKHKKKTTKIYNNYKDLKFNKRKTDIVISAIPGLEGLEPTIFFTSNCKKLLLANKESIICGWNIISKIAKKKKTQIIPLDSEHFSIHKITKDFNNNEIDKIYITASGGPFLNLPLNKFKNIKLKDALNHPKWSMGKKISIDSATLMNKILELIEAQKIFNFDKKKYHILIHPQSLVHAIVKFKNGITKLLYHETDMIIPISNAIFDSNLNLNDIAHASLNNNKIKNLSFSEVDKKRFPLVKILPNLNKYRSTPIIINAANEILVDYFLKRKIPFSSISSYLLRVLSDKNYKKYAIKPTNTLKNIYLIDNWSRNTTLLLINKKIK